MYRHPAHLARLATDLDNLSNGRHILGLGSGWLRPEFNALGREFGSAAHRLAALEDTLAIVHGVWSEPPFSYQGTVFSTENMVAEPRPVQQPRPPIVVAGNGERVTLRLVAQWGDACNVREEISLTDDTVDDQTRAASIRRLLDALDGHCDAVGRDPAEVLRTHFTLYLILGETMAEARAKANALDTSKSTSPGTRRDGTTSMLIADPGPRHPLLPGHGRDRHPVLHRPARRARSADDRAAQNEGRAAGRVAPTSRFARKSGRNGDFRGYDGQMWSGESLLPGDTTNPARGAYRRWSLMTSGTCGGEDLEHASDPCQAVRCCHSGGSDVAWVRRHDRRPGQRP